MLMELRKQIRNNNLKSNLGNFTIGFVLGGLISLLRESEANIEEFNNYLEIGNKIRELEKDCENEEFLAKVCKKTIESIDEISSYLEMKSETFYSTIKVILDEFKRSNDINNNAENIIIDAIKEYHNDRDGFYLFSNIILVNPILYEKFEKLCKENNLDILSIHKSFLSALRKYQQGIEDKDVVHLVDMFLKNPIYS